ncbi:hypothetical protein [Fibrella forsythiae]|uniref:Uncharacterized protein n=1 Tax=Fibrella forsythiae TaxID=2817061 RepID=A0ABS3JSZ6_9BACT|nr:hypothetical protein [Fibrella forsythiae]MBO0953135.1 hypothetical protein [Fibrella forsythiae]
MHPETVLRIIDLLNQYLEEAQRNLALGFTYPMQVSFLKLRAIEQFIRFYRSPEKAERLLSQLLEESVTQPDPLAYLRAEIAFEEHVARQSFQGAYALIEEQLTDQAIDLYSLRKARIRG